MTNEDLIDRWSEACERATRQVKMVHPAIKKEVVIEEAVILLGIAHQLAGVACRGCGGKGQRCYSSTATWRGGVGGAALTDDVCDVCWGTGRTDRIGPNLRRLLLHRGQSINIHRGPTLSPDIVVEQRASDLMRDARRKVFSDGERTTRKAVR